MKKDKPLPQAFIPLAWSNLAAQAAEQLSLAAVPLVAVLKLNSGPGEIGFLAPIQTLPFLLLSGTPGAMLGRVSAIFLTVNAGVRPWGAALGGVVGLHLGEAACLALSLFGFCIQAALIVFSTVRTLQVLPATDL